MFVEVRLRHKYYAPQVRSDWGSKLWPLAIDHDSIFHVTETIAVTTRPSGTFCLVPNLSGQNIDGTVVETVVFI